MNICQKFQFNTQFFIYFSQRKRCFKMQLKELEYLLKTVECGSITKAAEQMFISQPTLTKNIQSLENEYNIKIFQRVASGVELTEQGKDFVYYAREVVAAKRIAEQQLFGGNANLCSSLCCISMF